MRFAAQDKNGFRLRLWKRPRLSPPEAAEVSLKQRLSLFSGHVTVTKFVQRALEIIFTLCSLKRQKITRHSRLHLHSS